MSQPAKDNPSTTPASPLRLDSQLCFALYSANRAVNGLYRPILNRLELTYPQYLVMLVLWEAAEEGQSLSVSRLGERLRLDSGTLTPLLKRLEARHLLERRRDAEDERVVRLRLTGEGRRLRRQAETVPLEMLCRTGMTGEEVESLRQALQRMLDRL